ncbi:MAG: DUF2357 domain-containing protein [Planctomycetaceae bacterium]
MTALFCIETDEFRLEWRELSRVRARREQSGLFRIRLLKHQATLSTDSWKASPTGPDHLFDSDIGPALFEETDYQIYLRALNNSQSVRMQHRDPLIVRHLTTQESGRVQHGVINFRGQAGQTTITICINSRPYAILELEVFPTKMDYQSDFRSLIADLQQHAQGLVWEYLRSTVHQAQTLGSRPANRLEWLLILRRILDSLDAAVRHISHSPSRRLDPDLRLQRPEQIRRVDAGLRRQIARASSSGNGVSFQGLFIPQRLNAATRTATLNTPEHRWLRLQLTDIQLKLAGLLTAATVAPDSERNRVILAEIQNFYHRIGLMLQTEPLQSADGPPDSIPISLQLLQAPGYREAFQCCQALRMGLAFEGDKLQLSIKELNTLYENWVLIAVLKVIRELAGQEDFNPQRLTLQNSGLTNTLARGREQTFRFQLDDDRRIEVVYNPQFQHQRAILIPQRPDVLIRLQQKHWPPVHIIVDAKYRIDDSPEYQRQFGSPGPPVDAINVLHRYRDAILESEPIAESSGGLRRAVVHAAAIFPADERICRSFRTSRLWQSLDRLGIGAIPALPHDLSLLREWLQRILKESGWEIARRIIPHSTTTRHTQLQQSSLRPALVQVLDQAEGQNRLNWIRQNQRCYVKMPKRPHRHFQISTVAFYCSQPMQHPPAIAWKADVLHTELVARSDIKTPWATRHNSKSPMILYHLGPVTRINSPLANTAPSQTSFRTDRWTTQLALDRASTAAEISLETEFEWQLYEALKARKVIFRLHLDLIRNDSEDIPRGRTWFRFHNSCAVRFDGANGFLQTTGTLQKFTTLEQILADVTTAVHTSDKSSNGDENASQNSA